MNQQQPTLIRKPLAPPSHIAYAHGHNRGLLTFEQIEQLVLAINPLYVQAKQGKSYLAQHQARAEMNRIFGYGNWDVIEGEPTLLYEYSQPGTGNKSGTTYWVTAYRASVTVHVRDLWGMPVCTVTGTHAEENTNLPNRGEAHALALTSVLSYALRRALINLGDRFGLGLYNGGSTAAHGQYTQQLFAGQLFELVDPTAPENPVAVAPAITHTNIQAEPVISDDGTDPNWVDPSQQQAPAQQQAVAQPDVAPVQQQPQQIPQHQQPGGMNEFHQAQEVLQQGREQARQQPSYEEPQYQQQPQQYQEPAPQQHAAPPAQFNPQQIMQTVDPSLAARLQGGFKQAGA